MKISMRKIPLWDTEELCKSNGSFKVGEIDADFWELLHLFGSPTFFRAGEIDLEEHKSQADWVIAIEVKEGDQMTSGYFTLYDWKEYQRPWLTKRWHLGGHGNLPMMPIMRRLLDHLRDCKSPAKRSPDSEEGQTYEVNLG
jgi:hypothetical protein